MGDEVPHDESPPPVTRKRQRVTQACDRCRTKKYRCDGGGPPCSACHGSAVECSYGHAGKRRGLKTGYVKLLEMLWGRVLQEVPGSEEVAIRLLASLSREHLDDYCQSALQRWRSSEIPSSIMSLLDGSATSHTMTQQTTSTSEDVVANSPPLTSGWTLDLPSPPQSATQVESTHEALQSEATHQDQSQAGSTHQVPLQNEMIHRDLARRESTHHIPVQSVSTHRVQVPGESTHLSVPQEQLLHQGTSRSHTVHQSLSQTGFAHQEVLQNQPTHQDPSQCQPAHNEESIMYQETSPPIELLTGPPPLPPEWHLLVQAYLSYEESWLPVVKKHSIWRFAYEYEASYELFSERNSTTRGDAATLWAALVLGGLHLDGAMSAASKTTQLVAHDLLTPAPSSEPGVSYAPAYLLWAIIHSSRREFILARMMLAQAFALAIPASYTSPETVNGVFLSNACFVVDIMIALATESRPMDLVSKPLLTNLDDGELTEWEPFIDPLRQQHLSGNALVPLKPRPSRMNSTYKHFMELCSTLKTALQNDTLRSTTKASLAHWSETCPHHLRIDSRSHDSSQDSRLPSEANVHIFSLAARSLFAASEPNVCVPTDMTPASTTRASMLNTVMYLEQHWDFTKLPSSVSIVADLLSTKISASRSYFSLGCIPPSIQLLNTNLCRQFAWRGHEYNNGCEFTGMANNDSGGHSLLSQDSLAQPSVASIASMSQPEHTFGVVAGDRAAQHIDTESLATYPTSSRQTVEGGTDITTLAAHDPAPLPSTDFPDTTIFDPADLTLPDTYMDLFDPNESTNQDFMRALGFVDVGESTLADST